MDKLDMDLIVRIEKALGLKFEEWQKNYMLDIPMVLDMRITGRGTGKTLVYILKLLFADDEPLRNYDIIRYSDDWNVNDRYASAGQASLYTRWFREELIRIYDLLVMAKLSPRQIIVREESKHSKEQDAWVSPKFNFKY